MYLQTIVEAPCLTVSNIYSSLAVVESLRWWEMEKKVHKRTSHVNDSLVWYESGFYAVNGTADEKGKKKRQPEPQRMEQLNCGWWGFRMRWKRYTFSLIFQMKALEVASAAELAFETIKRTFSEGDNIFFSPRSALPTTNVSPLTWLIGWAYNKVEAECETTRSLNVLHQVSLLLFVKM